MALDEPPRITVLIQCTSPFTEAEDIDACVRPVLDGEADCAFTVTPHHGFLWRIGDQGGVAVNHDASRRVRRQDLDPEFLETGAVYAMDTGGLTAVGHRFFGRMRPIVVPRVRSFEIDDAVDLKIALALAGDEIQPAPAGPVPGA
jgi:N-acylneuraminate cytidylyltransferase